jgi:type IV pilus assembly protein PilF
MKWEVAKVMTLALLGLAACTPLSPASRSMARAAEINVQLGIEYLKEGELDQALNKLERAVQQDPTLPGAHGALALLKQRLGQAKEAEKHFQRAIKLAPESSGTHNNYGVFLFGQGRYQEAEEHFLTAVRNPLYDTPELAYENAARAAKQRADFSKAEEYYRRALQINPRLPKSLYYMSEMHFEKGDYQQAREYLQRYQSVAQPTPQSLWLGIRVERELGNKDAASSYALQLRQDFPDSEEAQLLQQGREVRR